MEWRWPLKQYRPKASIDPPFRPAATTCMPTSVEYRFGHGRIIGAVGYNRAAVGDGLDRHDVNSAAGTQFGQPDTVGAKVSIPF